MTWAARLAATTGEPSTEADEAANRAAERAAIIAEGEGKPGAPVPHAMPCSWADASVDPTAGAWCRNCRGRSWWRWNDTTRLGWCCSTCRPAPYPDRARRITT